MVKLARASALQFAVNIGETVVGALVTLYLVRLLGFSVFGQYVLVLSLVNLLSVPISGIHSATMKRMSEGRRMDEYYTGGLLLLVAVIAVIGTVLFSLGGYVDSYVGFPATMLIVAFLALKSACLFYLGVLRGENRVESASLIEGGWNVSRSIFQLGIVLLFDVGVVGLVAGELLAAAISTLALASVIDRTASIPDIKIVRRLYTYGRYSWFRNLKTMSYSWTDTFVLGFFVPSAVVGGYEVAWRISRLFILLPTAIEKAVFPSISRRATEGHTVEIERILNRAFSVALLLVIPGVIGSAILGEGVIQLYGQTGVDLQVIGFVLVVLSVARIGESFETLLTSVLNALDLPNRTFYIGVTFTVTNVTLNLAFVPYFGVVGAAVATTLSAFLSAYLSTRAFPDRITISIPRKVVVVQFVGALVMGLVLHAFLRFYPADSDMTVVGYVAVGAVVYFVVVTAFSRELRSRLGQLLSEI